MSNLPATSALLLIGLADNIFTLHPKSIRKAVRRMDYGSLSALLSSLDWFVINAESPLESGGEFTKKEKRVLRKLRHIQMMVHSPGSRKNRYQRRKIRRTKKAPANTKTPE